MGASDVKRLGLILSIQATMEGMKAANEDRRQNNESMAYSDEDFQAISAQFENFSYGINEQLGI